MTTLNERLTAFTKQGGIFRRRNGKRNSGKTNGADMFLGAIVTRYGESAPDLDLCRYQERPSGIVELLADDATDMSYDAQNPIPNNINIKYTKPARQDEFIAVLGAGKGSTVEQLAVIDVDNPGFVEAMAPNNESIAQVPPFRILGIFMATYSAVSGKARHAWIEAE